MSQQQTEYDKLRAAVHDLVELSKEAEAIRARIDEARAVILELLANPKLKIELDDGASGLDTEGGR